MDFGSPVALDDMITHNDLLERYPWLSAQIVNGWVRRGLVRTFRGNKGMMVYSRTELDRALNEDMIQERPEDGSTFMKKRMPDRPISSQARDNAAEADLIRERLWLRSLETSRKRTAPKPPS